MNHALFRYEQQVICGNKDKSALRLLGMWQRADEVDGQMPGL
jgi:hypothetical protein